MVWDEPLAGVDYATQELLAGVAAAQGVRAHDRHGASRTRPFRRTHRPHIVLADGRVLGPSELHRHGPHGGHEVAELERPHTSRTGLEVG